LDGKRHFQMTIGSSKTGELAEKRFLKATRWRSEGLLRAYPPGGPLPKKISTATS